LATRPVSKVLVKDTWPFAEDTFVRELKGIHKSGRGIPKGLSFLMFEKFSKLGGYVTMYPTLFANLQHIGTMLHFPSECEVSAFIPLFNFDRIVLTFVILLKNSQIKNHLLPFTSLPLLSSIDVMAFEGSKQWNAELLARLGEAHRNLKKVLIHGNNPCVWELKPGTGVWETRTVAPFSSWDILRGALDYEGV
jgi:hypothetical protein